MEFAQPRLLELVEEYNSMLHGETRQSFVDLIPFQVIDILDCASHFEILNLKSWLFIMLVDYFAFNDSLC